MNICDRVIKKYLLMVEDDPRVMDMLRNNLSKYSDLVHCHEATDAGQALERLRDHSSPMDAIVLDIMMSYGDALNNLQGQTDPDQLNTGVQVLECIRREDGECNRKPIWVAVITARANHLVLEKIRALIADHGMLFIKPFDLDLLEDKLAKAMGIPSQVPPELLNTESEDDD